MKVIDCFPFFDELDTLEIRLNELKSVVDVFVITESPQTFTGKAKPLFLKENAERFKDFPIVHAIYDDSTPCPPMERERRQKQYNLDYAFDNVRESGDIIMYGDCDEIPKASVLSELLEQRWQSVGLSLTHYYYYLNCRGDVVSQWPSIVLTRSDEKINYDVTRKNKTEKLVRNAGYHFSYFGDIAYKLESWGHADQYNRPPFNSEEHIRSCKESGTDFLLRTGKRKITFEFVGDLGYLPKHVLENLDQYRKYIRG